MQPLISIVIPFYNDKIYLEQCIKSILQQDFANWEAIFVDDASDDGSTSIVEKSTKKDKRILLFRNKKNCGAAQSRKNGLAYAKGMYIMFLDGDDMLAKHALASLWQGIQGADVCVGQHYILQGEDVVPTISRTRPGIYHGDKLYDIKKRVIYSEHGYGGMSMDGVIWQALFRRSLIYDNLPYVDSKLWFSEDHLLFAAIMMDVSVLHIIDDYVYFYRKHGTNMTVRYEPFYFENSVRLYRDFCFLIENKGKSEIMLKTNDWFFLKNIEHSIKREVLESGKDYPACKSELNKIRNHPLVDKLLVDENLSVIDRSGRKYLKLLRLRWFRFIYISLKWKKIKNDIKKSLR